MNKIALSLVALAALTGAAFAEKTERDDHVFNSGAVVVETAPAAIGADINVDATDGISAFERQQLNAADGDNGEN